MPGIAFGQTRDGKINLDPYCFAAVNSPAGTALIDGSRLICKAGGKAWFVAPSTTQISSKWANGTYNGIELGFDCQKCCISEWGILGSCLSTYIYNYVPGEWFVPCSALLSDPGAVCRSKWDSFCPNALYWSSSEARDFYYYGFACRPSAGNAYNVCFCPGNPGLVGQSCKNTCLCVRAFKCVTY